MISPSFLLKLAPYAIGALVVIGAFFYIKNLGVVECEREVIIKEVNANTERQKINHEVKSMDHQSIINELASNGWLRND